jgi:hypothetical protein
MNGHNSWQKVIDVSFEFIESLVWGDRQASPKCPSFHTNNLWHTGYDTHDRSLLRFSWCLITDMSTLRVRDSIFTGFLV